MLVEVSNGELLDKLSILYIKFEKGLNVSKEYDIMFAKGNELTEKTPQLNYLYQILMTINKQLWSIEDEKRTCESNKSFDETFTNLARLVYMLNDERARIKKLIDTLTNSEISEQKSHNTV